MLITMQAAAQEHHVDAVLARLKQEGLPTRRIAGVPYRIAVGCAPRPLEATRAWQEGLAVQTVSAEGSGYPLCQRTPGEATTVVQVGDIAVGGPEVVVMAGPCAVENEAQLLACAKIARAGGAQLLRGGAYKPRSSPYAFQGLGPEGLAMFARVKAQTGLGVVTEVMAEADIGPIAQVADLLQVGARNMQNFSLLRALGKQPRPVLLKRGLSATYEEWLMAAEYIAAYGNPHIILCERGIRTFEPTTRNTLDLNAVPVLRERTHLPIVVDPSHGTGARAWVPPMARAALAAGADGLLLEMHPDPDRAWSDGPQSLTLPMFSQLTASLGPLATVLGRRYPQGNPP